MIKFTPDIKPTSSVFGNPQAFVKNMETKSVAMQLQALLGDKACPDHPGFHNEILIHCAGDIQIGTVQAYCCDQFKKKLDLIAQNKKAFEQ